MKNVSWKDVLHYGSALGLVIIGAAAEMGLRLPGVTVDPVVCFTTAAGIFGAGLKGGITSGVKAIALIAFLVAALAAADGGTTMAQAATSKTAASLAAFNTNVLQAIAGDAQAASADAASNNDTIAKTCYDAIAGDAQAKLSAAQVPGGGVLTAFQKVRDVTRMSASPQGMALIVGCAPLVQDAKLNFVQFFTNIGAAVLLKGIIPLP